MENFCNRQSEFPEKIRDALQSSKKIRDIPKQNFDRTRGASGDLRKPVSQRCLPAVNMCAFSNSCEALLKAETLTAARYIAKKISKEARHA